MASDYSYSEHAPPRPLFLPNRVGQVQVEFDGHQLALKAPHFGSLKHRQIRFRSYLSHLELPSFGLALDPSQLLPTDTANGYSSTNYPSVYVSLCTEGRQRVIPPGDSGQVLRKDSDLKITLDFEETGANGEALYVCYLFYSDCACVLDLQTGLFTPYYHVK